MPESHCKKKEGHRRDSILRQGRNDDIAIVACRRQPGALVEFGVGDTVAVQIEDDRRLSVAVGAQGYPNLGVGAGFPARLDDPERCDVRHADASLRCNQLQGDIDPLRLAVDALLAAQMDLVVGRLARVRLGETQRSFVQVPSGLPSALKFITTAAIVVVALVIVPAIGSSDGIALLVEGVDGKRPSPMAELVVDAVSRCSVIAWIRKSSSLFWHSLQGLWM